MAKKILSLLIIFSIVSLLCSCSKNSGVTMLVPIESDPMCLDPQTADTESAKLIINNCFEGLVRLDENNKIIPGVAEKWDISSDGKTYTFHLRNNSNWQLLKSYKTVLDDENYMENFDTIVKAKDFVFGLQRAVDPATQCVDAAKLMCIENADGIISGQIDKSILGVNADDDFTLTIRLSRANPDFLRLLTLPMCMPCNEEFFNQTHARYGMELKYTFCNGPFYLARWTDDNLVAIIKNEGYVGNCKVLPDGVSFVVNSDDESVKDNLKQSSYDCAVITDNLYNNLYNNKKLNFISTENTVSGLCFNCTDSVLKNSNLRKAISLVTKTDNIKKPERASSKAYGVVPGCVRFGENKYRDVAGKVNTLPYDELNAAALWEAGLEESELDCAKITITCTEDYSAQMQNIIQLWQKVFGTSVVAKVDVKSEKEIEEAIYYKDFQIVVSTVKAETSNVTDMLEQFKTGNEKNIFNYSDKEYDEIVDKIIRSSDGNGIIANCRKAETRLIEEGVFCPLFNYSEYFAIGKDVSGIYPSSAFENTTFISGAVD